MRSKELTLQLTELGLTEHEARVYLTGIKKGPSLLAHLSESAEIPRSSTYEIVEGLLSQRLFTASSSGKRTLYTAAAPMQLLKDLLNKEQLARSIIPQLEMLMPSELKSEQPNAEVPLFDID